MTRLESIQIYPIKSLAGVSVSMSTITSGGTLEHDRRFAIRHADGSLMTAKRSLLVHSLRCAFEWDDDRVTLWRDDESPRASFSLSRFPDEAATWFSDHFGEALTIVENTSTGFPDDPIASGPTIVSTATLTTVASWFPGMRVEECRARFRANLEVEGVEPFWEDRLFGIADEPIPLKIGDVELWGIQPCQRCVVPSRVPTTGEVWPRFQIEFAKRRSATLPKWAEPTRFDHYYRLATNTRIESHQFGQRLRVGDSVSILDER